MKQVPYFLLFVLSALLVQFMVFDNILIDVYGWQLKQSATVEGGILLLVILLCYILINRFIKSSYSLILVGLITMLYLINTNLLLPTIVAVLYFEVIFSIGSYVNRKFYKDIGKDKLIFYFKSFLIGFTIWSIINLILALIGFGTVNDIRITTLVLFLLSLHKGINKPFIVFLIEKFNAFSNNEKNIISFLLVLILALLSKSNRAIEFDSIWYGLRPGYVLMGENSFFESLGLVDFVHYYPKLFEFFTLPLSNMNDYSFIYCINIIFFILSLIVIYKIFCIFSNKTIYSLIGTVMLATIPAFANISATAKPDIFSIFFILLGVYFLLNFVYENKSEEILFGLSSFLLALGGKSTSFLYVPFILFGFLIAMIIAVKIYDRKYFIINSLYKLKRFYWLLAASLMVFLLICYRTFKLTGYPVYPSGLSLWNKIGFNARYPVTSVHDVDGLNISFSLTNIIERWYKLLLDPKDYDHIIMLWPGNLTIFLTLVFTILFITRKIKLTNEKQKLLILFVMPVAFIGTFFATFMINAGDGNYFIVPIILLFITIYSCIRLNSLSSMLQKWITITILIFLPFQSIFTFVSHPSWFWGTQEFSTNLEIYQHENNNLLMETNGVTEIEEYLRKLPDKTRTIGFGDVYVLNHLSTRFESIVEIASDHLGNSSIVSSEKKFIEYLKWAKIDFIIISKEEVEGFESVKNVISLLEKDISNPRIEAQQYILLDIRNVDTNIFDGTILGDGWYEEEDEYRWINKNATAILQSGDIGELILEGFVPDNYDEITLSIIINGENIAEEVLNPGNFQIKQEVPKNQVLEIKINANKSFVPKEDGISNDIRELSILVKRMEIR